MTAAPLHPNPDAPEPTEEPELVVSVLGPLRATRHGADLALGGRRQRAVLARLAVAGGRVVAAERLVDELWDGEPPPSATNTLQSYVSNLRRVLGPGPDGPAIERVGEGYRLALAPGGSSSDRFEELVARAVGRGPGDPADAPARLADLEAADALWHGRALADVADEPWAQGEAVRLEELRLAAAETRFDLLLDLGRHAVIVGDLDAATVAHPLRERFAHQLILALHRCGRQAEALRAYERTRAHLGEELGLEPSPELTRLADAVLAHDPDLDLPEPVGVIGSAERPATAPAGPDGAATDPGAAAPVEGRGPTPVVEPPRQALDLPPAVTERRARTAFVGRGDELAQLQAAWDDVAGGDRRLVVLRGEPGMGKTRIAQHFSQWVHDEAGGHVLWGRCTAENLIAYQPAVEALRTALRAVSTDRVRSIIEPRPALGLLLPDVVDRDGQRPTRAERYELYEALADVIGTVAASAPLVFVVDDVQWADGSSVALIDHLLRSDRSGRLLVVATLRRPAGRPTPELDVLLADQRRDQRLVTVDVDGLGVGEVAELLGAHGVAPDEVQAASLHARTGGNPFFVESLAEHGADADLDPAAGRHLPDSVRDLLDQRLAALDPEAARVLAAAAVIGLRIDLRLLGAVTELAPDPLLDVVDAAVASGLLAEDEDLGWVTIRHALVRQALVGRLTRNREAQLHLRVADAIEADPAAVDRWSRVAHHLLAAGRACPPVRAARAAVEAGRAALDVLADDEARGWGRRALAVLDGAGAGAAAGADDPAAARAEALLLVATTSRHLGDRDTAIATLDELAELARSRGDGILLAATAAERAVSVAGIGFAFGIVDDVQVALLAEAVEALPDDEDELRAALLGWWSLALSPSLEDERQMALADDALAIAVDLADRPDVLALALLAQRFALTAPEHLEARLEIVPRLLAAARAAGWTELVVVGMVASVADRIEADDLAAADDLIDELGAYIAPFNRPAYTAYHLLLQGSMALLHGEHDRCLELATRALELGEPAHAGNAFQAYAAQSYLTARDRGTLPELGALLADMAAQFPLMPVWLTAHAACCVASGDPEGARAAYAPLRDGILLARTGDTTWYTTVAQLAEASWSLDDPAFAAVLVPLLEPVAHRLGATGMGACCIGSLHHPLGLALATAGDLDGGIEQLRLAVGRHEANDLPVWLARARAELALLLERRGDPDDAAEVGALRTAAAATVAERGVHLALAPDEYPLA